MLHDQSDGQIEGWQSTLYSQRNSLFSPIPHKSKFVQLLHTNSHWLTTSNIDVSRGGFLRDTVNIYDSARRLRISFSVKRDVCSFVRPESNFLYFDVVNIERQPNNYDCGLYSIACATELVHGFDPAQIRWDCAKMRKHLLACLDILLDFLHLEAEKYHWG